MKISKTTWLVIIIVTITGLLLAFLIYYPVTKQEKLFGILGCAIQGQLWVDGKLPSDYYPPLDYRYYSSQPLKGCEKAVRAQYKAMGVPYASDEIESLSQPMPAQNTNRNLEWLTYRSSNFNFSLSYPATCILSAGTDSPAPVAIDDMLYLQCDDTSMERILKPGYVYVDLLPSYVEDRLKEPGARKVNQYQSSTGENIIQIEIYSGVEKENRLVTYLNKVGSNVTLEIYGPTTTASDQTLNVYNMLINSIRIY